MLSLQTVDKVPSFARDFSMKRAKSSANIRTSRLFFGIMDVSKKGGAFSYDDSECG